MCKYYKLAVYKAQCLKDLTIDFWCTGGIGGRQDMEALDIIDPLLRW